jgi:5-methylcytosine-specific restriction endonuclease McrA
MRTKPLPQTPDYKQCPRCKEEGRGPRPWYEFFSDRGRRDGLGGYCKQHALNYDKPYKAAHAKKRALLIGGVVIPPVTIKRTLEAYGGYCLACGSTENITADHIVPLTRGGAHSLYNLQPLCNVCNSRKGARVIDYRLIWETAGNNVAPSPAP